MKKLPHSKAKKEQEGSREPKSLLQNLSLIKRLAAALLSKTALIRDINTSNKNPFYKELEDELLEKINELNIGPQGFGGKTTALAVNIETAPTHIAGLPVAINVGCYVTRHAECEV